MNASQYVSWVFLPGWFREERLSCVFLFSSEVDLVLMGGSESKDEVQPTTKGDGQATNAAGDPLSIDTLAPKPGTEATSPAAYLVSGVDTRKVFLGLENYGNTCYCNSVIQLLFHCAPLRNRLIDIYLTYYDPRSKAENGRRNMDETVLSRLAELFYNIETSKKKKGVIGPNNFIQKVKRENIMFRNMLQQDAHEFSIFVLNDLADSERKLLELGPKDKGPIQRLFEGQTVAETICVDCETKTARPEPFLSLSVDVEPNTSLLQCFKNFSQPEYLMGEEKYRCDPCTAPTMAKRALRLKEAAPLLLVHLKRFKYSESSQAFKKLAYRIPFPENLGLPFQSEAEKVVPFQTTNSFHVSMQPAPTRAATESPIPAAFVRDATQTDSAGTSPGTAYLAEHSAAAGSGKETLVHYRLSGFVVHHGAGLNVGHYVACCRTEGGTTWRKFDDDVVSVLSEREAELYFGYSHVSDTSVTSTAYILLYVREDYM